MHQIFVLFVIAFIIQLIFYWGIFARLAFYKKRKTTDSNLPSPNSQIPNFRSLPVSVVICAKNEFHNLQQFLPYVLEQDYPDFEVVVVNDCSDDDTEFLLEDFSKKYKNLKTVNIQNNVNFFSGKKFPLSVGIKSAKNDILLLTDSDCKPKSKYWIREMVSNYQTPKSEIQNPKSPDIVLGYGAFEKKPGFINKLMRYDTLTIAIQYLSFSLAGIPYMGVGRNLSYRKELFYKNKGFTSHYTIRSGDDDLFINQVAGRKNTAIEISYDSHTLTEPKSTFSLWLKQKKRHLTTGKYYRLVHKFSLGLFTISQISFFLAFILLLCNTYQIYIILSFFILRLISLLAINKKCITKLDERNLLLFSPLFEIIILVLNTYLIFSNLIFKSNKW